MFDKSVRIGESPFAREVEGNRAAGRVSRLVNQSGVVPTARPAKLFPDFPVPQQNSGQVNFLNNNYPITTDALQIPPTTDGDYSSTGGNAFDSVFDILNGGS